MAESARERIVTGANDTDSSAERRATELLRDRAQRNSNSPGMNDLRPRRFADYIGQRDVVNSIQIAVEAAKHRGDTLDHALFHGPPGLGKTTISQIIAREMDTTLVHTSGPALERPADVVGILSNQKHGDVSVHRRDTPPVSRGGGVSVLRDGRFPRRFHHWHRSVRQNDQLAVAESSL